MLQKTQGKAPKISPQDIQSKIEVLATTARQHQLEVAPVIRALFPKPVRMSPKGKAMNGTSLYTMSGQLVLNGAMSMNFERIARNEKGEVASALPLSFCFLGSLSNKGDERRGIASMLYS
jgi:hypothetical protein